MRLLSLMKELARVAPPPGPYNIYLVGGGTAVFLGFRDSSIDADLCSDRDEVFRDIQGIKERLDLNIEFARPEDFVPPLTGSEQRHVFIDRIGSVAFHHYDPYAQALSKIVRGFQRDLDDAREFVSRGMVDPAKLQALVNAIRDPAYARYPSLSRSAVEGAVAQFLAEIA